MRCSYRTKNTCSKEIQFDLNDNIVTNVKYLGGGCPGNLQAIPALVDGLTIEEINKKIGNINCGIKGTSCAKELSIAVIEAYEKMEKKV